MRLPPPSGQLVSVGTHRLHLTCAGEGPSVIFDAALGASSMSWTFVLPRIARFARACTYDRAGFGWSEPGPLPRTAGRIAAELRQLLQASRVPPPYVLVGHSFGALVIRIFADRHPENVRGLVLLDPPDPALWRDPSPERRALLERGERLCRYGERAARWRVTDLVSVLVTSGALPLARAGARIVGRGELYRSDEMVLAPAGKLPADIRDVARRVWTQPKFFQALGSQIAALRASAADVPDDQAFGDLPLVVVSSDQASTPADLAVREALAARSTRGRHLVASGSGHWIPLDRPDSVEDAIREVLAGGRR